MKADRNLVAQFVVEHGLATADQVRACLERIDRGETDEDLPALLRRLGHIGEDDWRILERVFASPPPDEPAKTPVTQPPPQGDAWPAETEDERFAKVILAHGMLTGELLRSAREEQDRRSSAGAAPPLDAVLLDLGFLTAFQIEDLQKKLARSQFRCEGCDKLYRTDRPPERCASCGLSLPVPGRVIPLEVGAGGRAGVLRVLLGTNTGLVYEVAAEATVTLGRHTRNKIRVYGKNVSREHAEVVHRRGATLLRDRQSRFGTFVNARRIVETELADGDLIKIGSTVLEYRSTEAADRQADRLFGRIAVAEGLARPEEVSEALEEQTSQGEARRRIGEILVRRKVFDSDAVADILRKQKGDAGPPSIPGYDIVRKIGEGGMGAVYEARQKSLDRVVALKVLAARLAGDKSFIRRFVSEARAAGRLNHPNIIRAIDVGEAGGHFYFAMEFVDGETVYDILKRRGAMDEAETTGIALEMLEALRHAEQHNLVHRDIKPDNIMISRAGPAKLCDLGLAKSTDASVGETRADEAVGTPNYVSPEQAKGVSDIDIRADIYSLGVTLYHMVTGQIPFRRGGSPIVVMAKHITDQIPHPRSLSPSLDRGFCKVLQMMTVKEREKRYQHPADVIGDLERIRKGEAPRLPRIIAAKSTLAKE